MANPRFIFIPRPGGGGGGGGSGVLDFGARRVSADVQTSVLWPGYDDENAQTDLADLAAMISPRDATLSNMFIRVGEVEPIGPPQDVVWTVFVNGVATALAVTLASDTQLGNDTVNTVAVLQGDQIDVRAVVAVLLPGALDRITATLEYGAA